MYWGVEDIHGVYADLIKAGAVKMKSLTM